MLVTSHRRPFVALLTAVVSLAACSGSPDSSPTTTVRPTSTTAATVPASFTVRAGTGQIAVLDAAPGSSLVVRRAGASVALGQVDDQGALLFRDLVPGPGYTVQSSPVGNAPIEQSVEVSVLDPDVVPPASLYTRDQTLLPAGGFGYIVTRDGTTLSANVLLPGPPEDGPYPTVVEYSGYSPSDPDAAVFAQLYLAQGFAYVGVNMRGTGCSGGSFRFFEQVQSIDGYDVVEAIAAQPWVLDGRVGLVGISYPGITQLFVAATQPPSLAVITPLSVIADTYRSNLYPGGILNTGFAVEWTRQRVDEARPFGQQWARRRADAGDEVCAANQRLRLQNPDLVAEIEQTPFYSEALGDALAPRTFVDRIEVPVFLAGAWQDEQTGADFATMLTGFTGTDHLYVDLVNGLHTEALAPRTLARQFEFLQLYLAGRVPDLSFAAVLGPTLGTSVWGVGEFAPFENRFAGLTVEEALARFEAEPPVRVLLEQGGDPRFAPGTPEPHVVVGFDVWPPPSAAPTSWWLGDDGRLLASAPTVESSAVYVADPDALPATFFAGGGSSSIWRADTVYDWRPIPAGTGLGFVSEPLPTSSLVVGSGVVDLWISATAVDTDLEVTLSEVRPDGTEVYVQSGWLRASHRAEDESAASDLRVVHTHLAEDARPLAAGEITPVRVELLPVAHAFRAGSRIRLTIDAPGNNRPVWVFRTISDGETVTVSFGPLRPARLVLPVIRGIELPAFAPPPCGWLRGQPCRSYVVAVNGG